MIIDKSFSRLRYLWRRHGPIQFFVLAVRNIVDRLRRLSSGAADSVHIDPEDEKYGTETSIIREVGSLDVVERATARYAVRYQPSGWQDVRMVVHQLGIDYREYSLIDFGSGKGRVLLVAAGFPFREVVGIEFSEELHQIASSNIKRLPSGAIRAGAVRAVHGDAGTFDPPTGNLVCYFYNPFGPPIISTVVQRLRDHHELRGFHVIIIYIDPQHRDLFEETGIFKVVVDSADRLILETAKPAGRTGFTPHLAGGGV